MAPSVTNQSGRSGVRVVTEHDVKTAGEIGEMKADIRTLKHDTAQISAKLDSIGNQIGALTNQQSKGLGFFAGAAFIVATFGAALIGFAKLIGISAMGGPHA